MATVVSALRTVAIAAAAATGVMAALAVAALSVRPVVLAAMAVMAVMRVPTALADMEAMAVLVARLAFKATAAAVQAVPVAMRPTVHLRAAAASAALEALMESRALPVLQGKIPGSRYTYANHRRSDANLFVVRILVGPQWHNRTHVRVMFWPRAF